MDQRIFLPAIFILLCMPPAPAQDSTAIVPRRVYITKSLDGLTPPVIDGVPDEALWDMVPWEGDFIEQRPDENTPPAQQTRFKILYDPKFLYVGIQCFDQEPDRIVKRLSRRDGFEGGLYRQLPR